MILVTGGAGYIGSIVAERLLQQGEQVCVYDNLSRGHREQVPEGAVFVEAELGDGGKLRELFRKHPIRAVMHFAAFALVGESMEDPGAYYRNNLIDSLALLEETQAAGVKRFVFSSTCAIFGERNPSPIGETALTDPINPYGETKLAFEKALKWYREIHGMAYFCLRYFNACGATPERGEQRDKETHLIPLVLKAAAGETDGIRVFGTDYPTPDGTCIRDYVHVEDLADAHILTLSTPDELSGCYNVGTGKGHSVREVIETARQVTGQPIKEIPAPRRPGDPAELVADGRRIQQKLGWRARQDLEAAVRSSWEFKLKMSHA